MTVSLSAGKWYVSIQTEREVPEPVHPLQTAVGIDMGIARFATLSDGSSLRPLHSFRKHEKKLAWLGGTLLLVPPQYTSQTCSHCGCVDKSNRVSQAKFKCTACGFECNADHNAALNILAAGQAVSACGAGSAQAPVLNQEPAYGAAR